MLFGRNDAVYRMMLNRRDYRGSFTIEAALLMTVIIPVLTGLIYLGIYQHDKAWLLGRMQTTAVEMAVNKESSGTVKWNGIIGGEQLTGTVSRQKNKVKAAVKGSFFVPGLVMKFFAGGRLSLDCSVEKPVIEAKKEIQKFRNLERLQKGGET